MQTLSPYPYRNQDTLCAQLGITRAEAGDFTPSGFVHIIERLEAAPGDWARNALNRERRAYQIIHGAVKPYSIAELNCPRLSAAEIELELRAAKVFRYAA